MIPLRAHKLTNKRWTLGVAVAGGLLGPALFLLPALANNEGTPVATADTFAVSQDVARTLPVLMNDTDPDGDVLSIASVTMPSHGTIALNAGTLTYTPITGYIGSDTFNYTVSDGHEHTSTAAVTLNISNMNGVPVAQNDTITVLQNTATVLTPLSNDTDPEGDTISITAVSTPAHGTATLTAGTLTYMPAAAYTGADSFTYTITDGHSNASTGTVNITVSTSLGIPVPLNDAATVNMNTATSIAVLANDTDPEGQALTLTAVSTPTHGTASIAGGSINYTPTGGYVGADSFVYTVRDTDGHTATGMVAITVLAPTLPPVAQNDSATTSKDVPVTIAILANDTGSTIAVTSVGAAAHGTAMIAGTAVLYTPASGYTGADSFTYTIIDASGATATATVSVTIGAGGDVVCLAEHWFPTKWGGLCINDPKLFARALPPGFFVAAFHKDQDNKGHDIKNDHQGQNNDPDCDKDDASHSSIADKHDDSKKPTVIVQAAKSDDSDKHGSNGVKIEAKPTVKVDAKAPNLGSRISTAVHATINAAHSDKHGR